MTWKEEFLTYIPQEEGACQGTQGCSRSMVGASGDRGQEGGESPGQSLYRVFRGKSKAGTVNSLALTNSGKLWALGAVPGGPVPGLVCESLIR